MKTWIKSVWVKRLVPLVLLATAWAGYRLYQTAHAESTLAEMNRVGQVIAEVWVGSATYRDDPAKFIAFRDSLLKAKGITREEVERYIREHEDESELCYGFTRTVSDKVDSMYRIIDSTLKSRPRDTTIAAKKPKDTIPRIRKRMGSVPIYPEQK
jgi:hypothetical protein